ncbi:MAG TPA: hypothetical protein VK041_05890 [Opitutales bacterium]|nr:hypothetical protein [Opitutales bacterium]
MIRFSQILLALLLIAGSQSPVFVVETAGSGRSFARVVAPEKTERIWAAVPVEGRLLVNRAPENDPNPLADADLPTAPPNPARSVRTAHFLTDFSLPASQTVGSRRFARAPPCQK